MATIMNAVEAYFRNAVLPTHNNQEFFSRWLDNCRNLETQVLTSPAGGYPVEGARQTYTDGAETWFNIRWPKKAMAEPYWRDYELDFLLDNHWEGLGTTWWDWVNRESVGLGFDFDIITDHAPGIGVTEEELELVRAKASALDYVDVLRSSGGAGTHLYLWFESDSRPKTANHTEHAALGRAMLGKLSTDAGFDFGSHLDVCGGNMWIAHRTKMTPESQGFCYIKKAARPVRASEIPPNWKDHLDVVNKKTTRVRVIGVGEDGREIEDDGSLADLTSAKVKQELTDTHRAIINDLEMTGYTCVWISDHHLVQTHTTAIKQVYDKWLEEGHPMKGYFETLSSGSDEGKPNCFMIPGSRGSFMVFRFGKGTAEHKLWNQDRDGWTWCHLNRQPTLSEAAIAMGGVEDATKGGFHFDEAKYAVDAISAFGAELQLPAGNKYADRHTVLKKHKDGRLIVQMEKFNGDVGFDDDWVDKKKIWERVYNINTDVVEDDKDFTQFDSLIRSVRTPSNVDAGWMIRIGDGNWVKHPEANVKKVLRTQALTSTEVDIAMGQSVVRQWTLVNLPFHEEYPGGRQWNIGAPQLVFQPVELDDGEAPKHPYWDLVLSHCGGDLTSTIKETEWCKKWGIYTGADYLATWIACMFREPFEPLPYLFMYGPQNSGKSIFHEAISLLVTGGVVKADRALTNKSDFNGELANAVLGVVDEVNIANAGPTVYNKIKEWVTGKYISLHRKGMTVYEQKNSLHLLQMANNRDAVPVFPGDTRITMMFVGALLEEIPKQILLKKLEEEGPHIMHTLMNKPIPASNTRLRLPIIETEGKRDATIGSMSPLEAFIDERCFEVPGGFVEFKDFFEKFMSSLEAREQQEWGKRRVRRNLSELYPLGNWTANKLTVGNLSLTPATGNEEAEFIVQGGRLVRNVEHVD